MGKFTDKVSILKSTDLGDCFSLLACLLRGTYVRWNRGGKMHVVSSGEN